MRCDVNVSVRPRGQEAFGTKVEVKNMNSFSNMQKAIEFEIERQVGRERRLRPRPCCLACLACLACRSVLPALACLRGCPPGCCPPQVGLIRAGKAHEVVQETRLWDENKQVGGLRGQGWGRGWGQGG
jgi:hypothetical protein